MTRQVARRVAILTVLASVFLRCSCFVDVNKNENHIEHSPSKFNQRKRVLTRDLRKRSLAGGLDKDLLDQYQEMFDNIDFSMSIETPSVTTTSKSSKKSKRQSYDVPLEHYHLSHHPQHSIEKSSKGSKKSTSGDSILTYSAGAASTHFGGINLSHKAGALTEAKQNNVQPEQGMLEYGAAWDSTISAAGSSSVQEEMAIHLPAFTLDYRIDGLETPDISDFAEVEELTRLFLNVRMEEKLRQESLVIAEDSFAEISSRNGMVGYPIQLSFNPELIFDSNWSAVPSEEELDLILVESFLGRSLMEYIAILQRLEQTNVFSSTTTVVFNRSILSQPNLRNSSSNAMIAGISAGAITLLILSAWAVSMRRRHEKRHGMLKDIHRDTIPSDVTSLIRDSDDGDEEEGLPRYVVEPTTYIDDDDEFENDQYSYADEGNDEESYATSPSYGFQSQDDNFSLAESLSFVCKDPVTMERNRSGEQEENDIKTDDPAAYEGCQSEEEEDDNSSDVDAIALKRTQSEEHEDSDGMDADDIALERTQSKEQVGHDNTAVSGREPPPRRRMSVPSKKRSHRKRKTKLHSWLIARGYEAASVDPIKEEDDENVETVSVSDFSSLAEMDQCHDEGVRTDENMPKDVNLQINSERETEREIAQENFEAAIKSGQSQDFAKEQLAAGRILSCHESVKASEIVGKIETSDDDELSAVHSWLQDLKIEQKIAASDGDRSTNGSVDQMVPEAAYSQSMEHEMDDMSDISDSLSWLVDSKRAGSNAEYPKTVSAGSLKSKDGTDLHPANASHMKNSLLDLRHSYESLPEQVEVEDTHLSRRSSMSTRETAVFKSFAENAHDQGNEDVGMSSSGHDARINRKSYALVEELKGRLERREKAKPNFDFTAVESNHKSRVYPKGRLVEEMNEKLNDRSNSKNKDHQMDSTVALGSNDGSHSNLSLQDSELKLKEIDDEESKLAKYPWNKIKDGASDKDKGFKPTVIVDFIAPGYTPSKGGSDSSDLQSRYKEDILKDQRKKVATDEQSVNSNRSYNARLPVTQEKKSDDVPWWLPDESSTSTVSKTRSNKRRSTIWEDEEDTLSGNESSDGEGSTTSSSYHSETPSMSSSMFGRLLHR